MVWVRLLVYFYKRNETFYFSRAIRSDLLHRFNKQKIEVSLRTKSEANAAHSLQHRLITFATSAFNPIDRSVQIIQHVYAVNGKGVGSFNLVALKAAKWMSHNSSNSSVIFAPYGLAVFYLQEYARRVALLLPFL